MPWLVGVTGHRLLALRVTENEAILVCVLGHPLAYGRVGEAGLEATLAISIANIDGQPGLVFARTWHRRDLGRVALPVNPGVVVVQLGLASIGAVTADGSNVDAILGRCLDHFGVGRRRRGLQSDIGAFNCHGFGSVLFGAQWVLLVDEDICLARIALNLLRGNLHCRIHRHRLRNLGR